MTLNFDVQSLNKNRNNIKSIIISIGMIIGLFGCSATEDNFFVDNCNTQLNKTSNSNKVRLTEVTYSGVGAYKIEMQMGTVYFEKDKGVSGFKSFMDPDGADWIASYLPPGPNGEFRGFPNSVGNFGHAGRVLVL